MKRMNLGTSYNLDSLGRHRATLREQSERDLARSELLKDEGEKAKDRSTEHSEAAADKRHTGETLAKESDRLRRNGREQSLRGLDRLERSQETLKESSSGFGDGLGKLKEATEQLSGSHQDKGEALGTIRRGLSQQDRSNANQDRQARGLGKVISRNSEQLQSRGESLTSLGNQLETQETSQSAQERGLGDFLALREDFEAGSQAKRVGFGKVQDGGVQRVIAEGLEDAADGEKLQETWNSADSKRHDATSNRLLFNSLWESIKATTAAKQAEVQQGLAEQNNHTAAGLQAQARTLEEHSRHQLSRGRTLEYAGHNHVSIGRQMQMCPWTYCTGVALERQGHSEIAQAQNLKRQAQQTRNAAHQKSLQAEELKVKAEQASERGRDFEITERGSRTRSKLLKERADEHQSAGQTAAEKAAGARERGETYRQQSDLRKELGEALTNEGSALLTSGLETQNQSLQQQQQLKSEITSEFESEKETSEAITETVDSLREGLGKSRSFINRGRSLHRSLEKEHQKEARAQDRIQGGVADLQEGVESGIEATERAEEALKMLEEARELELEGLRLQNRGQRMLLASRPKMADAQRLSSESYDAFQGAHDDEEKAQALLLEGESKLAAAAILKDKAEKYRNLASS